MMDHLVAVEALDEGMTALGVPPAAAGTVVDVVLDTWGDSLPVSQLLTTLEAAGVPALASLRLQGLLVGSQGGA